MNAQTQQLADLVTKVEGDVTDVKTRVAAEQTSMQAIIDDLKTHPLADDISNEISRLQTVSTNLEAIDTEAPVTSTAAVSAAVAALPASAPTQAANASGATLVPASPATADPAAAAVVAAAGTGPVATSDTPGAPAEVPVADALAAQAQNHDLPNGNAGAVVNPGT